MMEQNHFSCRGFIRTSGLVAVALGVTNPAKFAGELAKSGVGVH
jgi:hypothetical protein